LFHFFFFRYFSLLDGGLHADENLVETGVSDKYIHVPEMMNTRMEYEDAERSPFYVQVERDYREFLQQHEDKEVILCFGDLEPRKGFDYLLKLVDEHEDLVLVRCGRTKPHYRRSWEDVFHKEHLIVNGRLFELDVYIQDQKLVDVLFESTKYILLPYKHFYRTSGSMIQALSYGKPVLVPDTGLLRDRIERHKLGRTFEHLSYESFCSEYRRLRGDYQVYADDVEAYMERYFSGDYLGRVIRRMLA
jgi:glycosyltransferase involved in cell wall biosynthesis